MRRWIGLAVALAVVLMLALVALSMGRGIFAFMNGAGSAGEPDPMFAEPAETVTRPPLLLDGEDEAPAAAVDRSADWVYAEMTPIDGE